MNNEIKPFLFLSIFVKELFHKRQYVSLRRLKVAILMWQILRNRPLLSALCSLMIRGIGNWIPESATGPLSLRKRLIRK